MENTPNSGLNSSVKVAFVIVLILLMICVAYYGSLNNILDALNKLFNITIPDILNFSISFQWLPNYRQIFFYGMMIFAGGIILFVSYKIILFLLSLISDSMCESEFIEDETVKIENLLLKEDSFDKKDIELEIENLRRKLDFARDYEKLHHFIEKLKDRLENCLKLLREIKKDERLNERQKLNEWITRKNEELDEENRIKATYENSNAELICYQLGADDKSVFKKEKLSKNQIKALEKKGYHQINEYSIHEQKYIRVLVKPTLNHSKTHTFLVWDAIRLLKNIKEVSNIQEKQTVDADITFNFHKRKFALEVETGTLLGKKEQKEEKINYLNRKYNKRWIFIVSNKNILPKYKKLGFATQRSRVLENLKIMLEKY